MNNYINMKLIQSLIITIKNKLFKDTYVPTGRWCQNLSQSQLIRRIELANEDHCGPCGLTPSTYKKITDSVKFKP